ncbi:MULTISPECIES: hypothetical protein [unclassified Streptomyces]|nr:MULTISPECIES: hypothetical protein [unclassified Streptomyces]MCX5331388.1 hypothetical protein [Streptomyces sp. NBC_00140]MCX5360782.1 hypothetical protein [Streptomyces sp. NBC_00124]
MSRSRRISFSSSSGKASEPAWKKDSKAPVRGSKGVRSRSTATSASAR